MTLRQFGWIEGASMVALLFVAMPLKYLAGLEMGVRIVGMVHGWLFLAFIVWVVIAARRGGWPFEKVAGAMMASVIPFAPFVADLSGTAEQREQQGTAGTA